MSNKERNEYLREIKACELCGSKKRLEVHHIIPRVCDGPDVIDNWIVVCTKCHALLTPRSLLTKIGQRKAQYPFMLNRFKCKFYEAIEKEIGGSEDYCSLSSNDILDIFEEIMCKEKQLIQMEGT